MVATYHIGLERRVVFSLQQFPPVDAVKELVRFNL